MPGLLHWSSDQSLNVDNVDQLLTYEIIGLDEPGTGRLLLWDDQLCGGDRDFNDLVIAVKAIAAIPFPGWFCQARYGWGWSVS